MRCCGFFCGGKKKGKQTTADDARNIDEEVSQESSSYDTREVDEEASQNTSTEIVSDNIKQMISAEFSSPNSNIPLRHESSQARTAILSLLNNNQDVRNYALRISKILPQVATRSMSVSTLNHSPPQTLNNPQNLIK